MVDSINNDNNGNEEELKESRRRENSKREVDKRKSNRLMKTFEAKLSEKSSLEEGRKTSQEKASKDQKVSEEERLKFIDKVLGSDNKNPSDLEEHARVHEKQFEDQKNAQDKDADFDAKVDDEKKLEEDEDQEFKTKESEKKSSEVSEDGHRRVDEVSSQNEGGGGSAGQGTSGDSDGSSARDFGSGEQGRESADSSDSLYQSLAGKVQSGQTSGGFQQSFQGNARNFSQENLDEIVQAAQVGIDQAGDEFFSVELTDQYFQGLKLKAIRTKEGVVLEFDCPNVETRSTFLIYRPDIYKHLQAKNVSVFRIDIV